MGGSTTPNPQAMARRQPMSMWPACFGLDAAPPNEKIERTRIDVLDIDLKSIQKPTTHAGTVRGALACEMEMKREMRDKWTSQLIRVPNEEEGAGGLGEAVVAPPSTDNRRPEWEASGVIEEDSLSPDHSQGYDGILSDDRVPERSIQGRWTACPRSHVPIVDMPFPYHVSHQGIGVLGEAVFTPPSPTKDRGTERSTSTRPVGRGGLWDCGRPDSMLVLNKGEFVEYGIPVEFIETSSVSVFHKMIEENAEFNESTRTNVAAWTGKGTAIAEGRPRSLQRIGEGNQDSQSAIPVVMSSEALT
ncbi:hypothetical protein BDK51DRAFT_51994 [Blyttiomyces helicus]|uniref:Uncharacterized protein n=1 Tax=Blyttiomyces helicus TaxID=388810 RepID=A0A4P9WBA3_9FUNG|nr:hypothetical protein BDK51DRAFT_51994 [Blyttiomyces helicus]|eukprot:RKO88823.1 hypothetical protein BDK51DRAFT_51994 [Blyttiomyces helicus]